MSVWRWAEAKLRKIPVPAGTSKPPTVVSVVVIRRHEICDELNRSTSSIAFGMSDGSLQI